MMELIAVATITILAVISPGADFAMVTRNSILFGRTAGLLSSFGIALGVQLHVFYTMIGVGLLIRNTPSLFVAIKLLGALYLVYIGYQTFFSSPKSATSNQGEVNLAPFGAFKTGFLTNALNPKTTLFVVSVYTQVVNTQTPLHIQIAYGLFMSFAHWLWFSIVSIFLSSPLLREKLLKRQTLVNQVIGIVLAALGAWLIASSIFIQG
jgi:threonine/homoserine/homoserine lactone efflux protein